MRKGRRLKRVRVHANNSLISMQEERGKVQNTNRNRRLKEDIGSKLLN